MSVPGRECLVACAGEDQNLDGAILVRFLADLREPLVHLEGERIARLRPIEGDAADAVAHVEKDVALLCHECLRERLSLTMRRCGSSQVVNSFVGVMRRSPQCMAGPWFLDWPLRGCRC